MVRKNTWAPERPGMVTIVAVIAGLLLLALVLTNNGNESDTQAQQQEQLYFVSSDGDIISLTEIDTDADGLKDWEEVLWETNPQEPDTDGDGTPDGEEVASRRSPTIPGPDDVLVTPTALTQNETSTTNEAELTQTQLFSRAFINTYIDTKIAGGSFTEEIDILSAVAVPAQEPVVQYTTADIHITSESGEDAIHEYGNSAGSILERNAPGVDNELVLILTAIQNDDPQPLEDLLKTSEAYTQNAEELLAISVPSEAADIHIDLVNAFLVAAGDIELMTLFFSDPLTAINGFSSYFESADELISALNEIGLYLDARTSFSESESGYLFISNL